MTTEEARLILNLDEFDDMGDAQEQKLFEIKQYLLLKVPFVKTYQNKIVQMERIQNAIETLGETCVDETIELEFDISDNPIDLAECLRNHQRNMSNWKRRIHHSNSLNSLKKLMEKAILMYKNYALSWTRLAGAVEGDESIMASIEFDPMDLIQAINGSNGKVEQNELLQKETKRLFLWLKYNGYE